MAVLKWTRKRPKNPQPRIWGAKLGQNTVGTIEEIRLGISKPIFAVTMNLPDLGKGELDHKPKRATKATLASARSYANSLTEKWLEKAGLERLTPR